MAAVRGGVEPLTQLGIATGSLTAAQAQQLETMARQGQSAAAVQAAFQALQQHLHGFEESTLSPLAKTWRDFKNDFTEALDALGNTKPIENLIGYFDRLANSIDNAAKGLGASATLYKGIGGAVGGSVGAVGGFSYGAAAGATVGTAVLPVGGTVIGGGVGGILGAIAGAIAGGEAGSAIGAGAHAIVSAISGSPASASTATAAIPPAGQQIVLGADQLQELVDAMVDVESSGNPNALSPTGNMGLMQISAGVAQKYGATNPYDPAQNVAAGTAYIVDLIKEFGNLDAALAAYNWGPGNVQHAIAAGTAFPASVQKYQQKVENFAGLPGNSTLSGAAMNGAVATQQNVDQVNALAQAEQNELAVSAKSGAAAEALNAFLTTRDELLSKGVDSVTANAAAEQARNSVLAQTANRQQIVIDQTESQISGINATAAAYEKSAEAGLKQAAVSQATAEAVTRWGTAADHTNEIISRANQLVVLQTAQERLANAQSLQGQTDQQQALQLQIQLQGQSSDEIQKQLTLLQAKQEIDQKFPLLSQQEKDARLQTVAATAQLTQNLQQAEQAQQRINQTFTDIAGTVTDTLGQAIENAFSGTTVTNWATTLKTLLGQIMAQITEATFIKPLLGSIAGSLGLGSVASSLGTLGGGGSLGSLFGGGSSGSVLVATPNPSGGFSLSTLANGASLATSLGGVRRRRVVRWRRQLPQRYRR